MPNTVGDGLSNLASFEDEVDKKNEDDDEEDTELGKLSDDDEPGWVMATISKTVQHRMQTFWEEQMRLAELTQPGWRDAADNFGERDIKYGMIALQAAAVVKPQTDTTGASPSPTTIGVLM